MPARRLLALLALPALVAGCLATAPPPVPVAMSAVPEGQPGANPGPAGLVGWTPKGAAAADARKVKFDDWSVSGESVRLSRRVDGMWAGTAGGRQVTLLITLGQVTGPGIDVTVEQDGKVTRIHGAWLGVPFQLALEPRRIGGVAGNRTYELAPQPSGAYTGPAGTLVLEGVAAAPEAPMPQLALALVAALVPPPAGLR